MPFCLNSHEVTRALQRREFQLYLQPKFDLASGTVYAVEALARWEHPVHGVLPPALFIPLLEKQKRLDALFFQLFDQGLNCQRQLHQHGFPLGFSFNLHPNQMMDRTFAERLQQRLQRHPLAASSLTLEITECALPPNPSDVIKQLTHLRLLGLRLSMDDYGTGYSSLQRLCRLPFDEIKLAGEFIQDLSENLQQQVIVDSTLHLARRLGLQLVVEGIETSLQRQLLLDLGVHQGQGYLCARPMPAITLGYWLKRPALAPLPH